MRTGTYSEEKQRRHSPMDRAIRRTGLVYDSRRDPTATEVNVPQPPRASLQRRNQEHRISEVEALEVLPVERRKSRYPSFLGTGSDVRVVPRAADHTLGKGEVEQGPCLGAVEVNHGRLVAKGPVESTMSVLWTLPPRCGDAGHHGECFDQHWNRQYHRCPPGQRELKWGERRYMILVQGKEGRHKLVVVGG